MDASCKFSLTWEGEPTGIAADLHTSWSRRLLLKEPERGTVQLFNIMGHTSLCVVKNKIYYQGKSSQTTLYHQTLTAPPPAEHYQAPYPAVLPSLAAAPEELVAPRKLRKTRAYSWVFSERCSERRL